jgi:hypothetical protein
MVGDRADAMLEVMDEGMHEPGMRENIVGSR